MAAPLKVLLTGATGQVGQACRAVLPPDVDLRALTHAELDIGDSEASASSVAKYRPDVLINCAAYTAVDKAESEPDVAHRVNALGAANLAAALASNPHGFMIQLSTDFVFDGNVSSPYLPDAEPRPLSVYGASKLAGEKAVREQLGARAAILRTSWVYSASGSNFVKTMLRLMCKGDVRVISDQAGTPTSAASLATIIWRIAAERAAGTFHWTDAGIASWYDFAVAIAEEAAPRGMVPEGVRVAPISTAEYPTPARRPAYSVLDKSSTQMRFGLTPGHWREPLRVVIEELRSA